MSATKTYRGKEILMWSQVPPIIKYFRAEITSINNTKKCVDILLTTMHVSTRKNNKNGTPKFGIQEHYCTVMKGS